MYRNKNFFLITFLICISCIFLVSCAQPWNQQNTYQEVEIPESEITENNQLQHTENQETQENDTNSEVIRERIESIRKRHELRDMFVSAEAYLEWWQQALWLKTLLDVYRENPNDGVVIAKIAETYYDMKRFGSSMNYYSRLPSLTEWQRDRVILLHFYNHDLRREDERESLMQELQKMNLKEQDLKYYFLSVLCVSEPTHCKERFDLYVRSLESIESEMLNNMRLALRNYESFWLSEKYLLYTYIITEWYKQWLYPLVIALWEEIINDRGQYKPAIKLVWHSFFELWKYEEAKDTLTKFHRIDDSDPWVNYMLWIIYAKTRDSVLANIFLKRALDLWYTPTLNLRRHIAYNFALIESAHNALKALENLIRLEEDFEKTDLSLAIYYHILYESYDTAIEFSLIGQELYPDDAYFYGYEWWALREVWKPMEAIEVLQSWLQAIPDNPFLYLQLVFALKESGNIDSMRLVLDTLLEWDTPAEYREIAQRERKLISH